MILTREKLFESFSECKNEIISILPGYSNSCIELSTINDPTENINISNSDIDINIDISTNLAKINFKSSQFANLSLSRIMNRRNWKINYEESVGLTQRDLNMFLNC